MHRFGIPMKEAFICRPRVEQQLSLFSDLRKVPHQHAGKAFAEMMGITTCAALTEALRLVFSTLLAVLLCAMSVFIIGTAAVFTIGGGSA